MLENEWGDWIGQVMSVKEKFGLRDESSPLKEKARMMETGIDIIVPVYRGVEETVECLESVLHHTSFPFRLCVICDCSPDKGMLPALETVKNNAGDRMRLIVHAENRGFVKSVNEGMCETKGDVVLLNSDTLVPEGWLNGMCTAAALHPKAATVTPLSTSAGPFTLFPENPIGKEQFPLYAQAVRLMHGMEYPAVPTGHGFCLFIQREAIEKVGLFDEETFGRGYGEENDFCVRASEAGFTHVTDCATLVYHAEGLSFGAEKIERLAENRKKLNQIHPTFKKSITACFRAPEWKQRRAALEERVSRYVNAGAALDAQPKKRLLIAMQDGKGGSVNNRKDLMRALCDRYDCLFLVGDKKTLFLSFYNGTNLVPLRKIDLLRPLDNLTFERSDMRDIYLQILLSYRIDAVNMSHLLGQTFDLVLLCRALSLPCIYVLHDYYTICPNFHLVDARRGSCGGACREDCLCVASKKWVSLPPDQIHTLIPAWRLMMAEYLSLFDALCAPDASVRGVFASVYPSLENRVRVIEHGRDLECYDAVECSYPTENERIRVVVLGNISASKGLGMLKELSALDGGRRLELHLFGDTTLSDGKTGIVLHGAYQRERLSALLKAVRPHYGLLPGAMPETYCHTLTELWTMGIPAVAGAVGALENRIGTTKAGWLFPSGDAAALYRLLTEEITQESYQTVKARVASLRFPTTRDMADQYEKLLFGGEGTPVSNEAVHQRRIAFLRASDLFSRRAGNEPAANEGSVHIMSDKQSLMRQIDGLQTELDKALTCYRRRIGDAVVEAGFHPLSVLKLPVTLLRIYKDYHGKGENAPALPTPAPDPNAPFAFRLPTVAAPLLPENASQRTADIVVCVHNALPDVRRCLQSILDKRTFPYGVILVDDGSDEETAACLRNFAALTDATLIRHETGLGYTISANAGLRASTADYVVLLNSDTVVIDRFIEKMIRAFESDKTIGVLSPLSNAATYQSIPRVFDGKEWTINDLPDGMNAEMMNLAAERSGEPTYPHLSCVNGFCFMIRRKTIDAIGYLDEKTFPKGYGEEVDYCLRAEKAGIRCCVLDDTYVFHAKSKSFTNAVRKKLSSASAVMLADKHGAAYKELGKRLELNGDMSAARERVNASVARLQTTLSRLLGKKIVFLLPAASAGGGVNSVCQEAMAMRALGLNVRIANLKSYREAFEANYAEWKDWMLWYVKSPVEWADEADLVICTTFGTVQYARAMKKRNRAIKVVYYVQDYEPWFLKDGDARLPEALASYKAIRGMLRFAKTDWICRTVEQKHPGASVRRVRASVDWAVYNPWRVKNRVPGEKFVVTAMVRPGTPRRNPVGTLKVLKSISERLGDRVDIHVFGCRQGEMAPFGDAADFPFINHDLLKRWEVAELLAESDLFVDMSTYQAFGRTGIEAMSLGCVPLLPKAGGADEYAVHLDNALIVDTADADAAAREAIALLSDEKALARMSARCIETTRRYDAFTAAWSEIEALSGWVNKEK